MDSNIIYPDTLLAKYKESFNEEGVTTGWGKPTKEAPYNSLLIRFNEIGDSKLAILLEFCFLPLTDIAAHGVYILQTFAVIKEKVPPSCHIELMKAVTRINTQLPLGAFGLFTDTGILYFKYNNVIFNTVADDTNVILIDRQCGMILHQFFVFTDMLLEVAEGRKSAASALENAPLL